MFDIERFLFGTERLGDTRYKTFLAGCCGRIDRFKYIDKHIGEQFLDLRSRMTRSLGGEPYRFFTDPSELEGHKRGQLMNIDILSFNCQFNP